MTDKSRGADLTRFLQEWSALWSEELCAQAQDPDYMPKGADVAAAAAMEVWRSAMVMWAKAAGVSPSAMAAPLDAALAHWPHPARTAAAAAAPDPRDAEIERLARRVDELEARLARLEAPRVPRARRKSGNPG